MMILNMGRGTGKTTAAIRASAENKIPIICVAGAQRQFIKERAKSLSLEIPEPIAAKRIADWASLHLDKVIVDDVGAAKCEGREYNTERRHCEYYQR